MQLKKKYLLLLLVPALILITTGCSVESADETETDRVENQQKIYINSQPVPAFDWSLERHIFIELYKARNNAVRTHSYIRNLAGQVVFSCESIGFPMPANTQLTNPERENWASNGGTIPLPQAEPNGLFTSPTNVGTYVFCVNSDGSVSPSYFEAEVEAHLSPLNENNNGLDSDGELKIKVSI